MDKENNIVKTENNNKTNTKFLICVFVFLIILLIQRFFITYCIAIGPSMEPTIHANRLYIMYKYRPNDNIERFDIVYVQSDSKNIIKRVIGLPGDTIQYIGTDLYINGEKTEDPFSSGMKDVGILKEKIILGSDEYMLLGDNRNNSKDGRTTGPVKRENFIGKIILRL